MTRKREHTEAEHIGSGHVGLAVMRMQPPHRGHMNLISWMKQDCDTVIVAFGSTQHSRVVRHPFTFEQRLEMLRAVVGDGIKPLPLVDIDSQVSTDDWVDYVLDKITKLNLPAPTDFYTGSSQDAKWYTHRFAALTDRSTSVSGVTTYHSDSTGRRLHIMDRVQTGLPAAEEIRSLIERRDAEWKEYVPSRLVEYIEWHYPPELRVALNGDALPPAATRPVGTRFVLKDGDQQQLFILHDDGKWREAKPK
jgi:cytidyltransferase-like protein